MKASALVGKTIKRVVQERGTYNTGSTWCIEAIEFTDGTWLRFLVLEGDVYGIEPMYPARPETEKQP
jgi:hypothetical protein